MMTAVVENWNDTVAKVYDEGFPLLMPRWGYVASAFVLFLIGFFGFFLNLLVILLMFKDRQLWTPLNIILFNLVCSDFSVSVLGNPFTLVSALFHRWVFGKTMCVMYGFFMALLGITSITTLTVLSFERYMMVTRPLSSRHLSSKGAGLSILFIWVYSLALTTPPLMGWGNYVNEAANISCSVNWHEQSRNTLTYILFLFAMGQIVPLGVITFSYVNIVRTLKKNSQRLGRVNKAEAKVTSMVFVMIISFTVAWTPYSVFALLEQFATAGIISPGAGVIPALVAKSSICYDPLIYVGMNTQFRQAIKRFFGIHKSKHSETGKGYENTIMSPAHKMSGTNEISTRYYSETIPSSSMKKPKDRKICVVDNAPDSKNFKEVLTNKQYPKIKLCTIIENKTNSDAKSSRETVSDEDSSNNDTKLNIFGESCHLMDEHSPVLTIVDCDKLLFSKNNRRPESQNKQPSNVYGNQAFETHLTDLIDSDYPENQYKKYRKLNMRNSFSLELNRVSNENKPRKYSVESTKLELFEPSGELEKSAVVIQFENSVQENFKSYLYTNKDKNRSDQL